MNMECEWCLSLVPTEQTATEIRLVRHRMGNGSVCPQSYKTMFGEPATLDAGQHFATRKEFDAALRKERNRIRARYLKLLREEYTRTMQELEQE